MNSVLLYFLKVKVQKKLIMFIFKEKKIKTINQVLARFGWIIEL